MDDTLYYAEEGFLMHKGGIVHRSSIGMCGKGVSNSLLLVCTRNCILLDIYTAVCYLIVKSDVCSLVPDIPIPFRGLPSACIRLLPGE